jgi:pimeloyl-ACP methyl ester carboxylesterase
MKAPRWLKISLPFLVAIGVYFAGPRPESPEFKASLPRVPESPAALEQYLAGKESRHKLKPDNEARIIWYDSSRKKTEYAVVYLHGFSASQMEGDPIHRRFAAQFHSNLLLTRLSDHGVDTTDALYYFTADRAWESAKEALSIGGMLGKKVIIMSTSTGGTLGLMLAARYPDRVHALINLSPNIAINDPAAFILNDPWGLHIARLVMGGKYRTTEATEVESKYWNKTYRLESLVELEELLESSMNAKTFSLIRHPSLTLYYYKNEDEQDPQVKVSAMLEMHRQLRTPDSLKVAMPIPNADAHVIGCSLTSKDIEGVYAAIEKFALRQLKMTPGSTVANLR